ncbi:hypothetical protein [Streptomyces sp. NPDC059564]|uniref:hypothetical protein n=1 Tax=Streptomyces sp. NPDC059564 TaxID=3346865 RepID=UPI0036AFFDF5
MMPSPVEPLLPPHRRPSTVARNLGRAVSAMVLAVSLSTLTAVCGHQSAADAVPLPAGTVSGPSVSGPADAQGADAQGADAPGIESRLVHLAPTSPSADRIRTVITDERELARFPGWFTAVDARTARDIAVQTAGTDFSKSVLVGWVQDTGCATATGAALDRVGDRLELRMTTTTPPAQCAAGTQAAVVFEVAQSAMPARPTFGADHADPPGPGTTAAFTYLNPGTAPHDDPAGTEVTQDARLAAFLSQLPAEDASAVRDQLAAHPAREGERRFGYVLSGCRATGVNLLISPEDETSAVAMSAVLTGGESARCIKAEYFAAVISVPAHLVPRPIARTAVA